jgi:hypothetical protein
MSSRRSPSGSHALIGHCYLAEIHTFDVVDRAK